MKTFDGGLEYCHRNFKRTRHPASCKAQGQLRSAIARRHTPINYFSAVCKKKVDSMRQEKCILADKMPPSSWEEEQYNSGMKLQ